MTFTTRPRYRPLPQTVRFPTSTRRPPPPTGRIVDVGALIASQEQLNRASSPAAEKNLTVAAFDSIIPIPYGRVLVPALLANAVEWAGYWHFWCIWGRGRIDGIEQIYINDVPWPAAGTYVAGSSLHLGDDVQALDPSLFLSITSYYRSIYGPSHPAFDQTMPGVAYTDVPVPVGDVEQPPTITVILRGKRVYDPRSVYQQLADPTTWTYSRNAALCTADFLRSTEYGAGRVVNDDSLIDAANACDVSGRMCDMLIDRKAKVTDHVATLATAANCYIDESGGEVFLIPDSLRSSVMSYAHASGNVLAVDGEQSDKRDDLPTVIEVVYTKIDGVNGDGSPAKWQDASVIIERDGVSDGSTPWRKSVVPMRWIQDEAQATREAYLRMNKTWLRTPGFNIQLMDEAVQPQVGEVITLTYPDSGYSSLRVKVGKQQATAQGWTFGVFYDDPGAYVDDYIADPTPPTDEPNPFDVPPVENLRATGIDGVPRFNFQWDAPANYPYTGAYPYTVVQQAGSPPATDNGKTIPPRTDHTTVDLPTGQTYRVTVWNRNVFGMLSEPRSILFDLDDAIYISAAACFTTPTLVNMQAMYRWSTGQPYWVTCMGDLWNDTFPSLLDSYTDPLYAYHAPGTSTLTTEGSDSGAEQVNALFEGGTTTYAISGTATRYIELASTLPSYTRHAGASYIGDGRYIRFSSETLLTATQRVDALGCYTVTRGQDGGDPVPPVTDPDFAFVVALLHLDAAFSSSTPNNATAGPAFTLNGSTISSAQSLFGGASVRFLGANGRAIFGAPSTAYQAGTGDFCIEAACRLDTTNVQNLCDFRSSAIQVAPAVYVNTDRTIHYYVNGTECIVSSANAWAVNTWFRWRVARVSGITRLFVDGVQVGSDYADSHNYNVSSQCAFIGAFNDFNLSGADGYIDEIRVTIGRGRGGVNYTVDAAAFPNS